MEDVRGVERGKKSIVGFLVRMALGKIVTLEGQ